MLLMVGIGGVAPHVAAMRTTRPVRDLPTAAPAPAVRELLHGIPQQGATLGDPRAPFEMVEFADLQCPYCAIANTVLLAPLIQKYVRTGQLKVEFYPLDFVGPDSTRLARVAEAMARQNHLWDFVELAFRAQGPENSAYATDDQLRRLVSSVPDVNVERVMADRNEPAALEPLRAAVAEAERLRVHATPTFFLGASGKALHLVDPRALTLSAFAKELARSGDA